MRFWALAPPDRVRFSPDTVQLKSLNPLRDKSPPKGWWDSVRGLKCLQRHDLMFKRIWLRSFGFNDDRGDEDGGRWKELAGSEVLVSEVLALEMWSGELGSGEASGSGSGSESRLWQMLSTSVCALSNKILKHQHVTWAFYYQSLKVCLHEKHALVINSTTSRSYDNDCTEWRISLWNNKNVHWRGPHIVGYFMRKTEYFCNDISLAYYFIGSAG